MTRMHGMKGSDFFGADGRMNRDEFNFLLRRMGIDPRYSDAAKTIWQQSDKNHDGHISPDELNKLLNRLMNAPETLDVFAPFQDMLACADRNDDGKLDNKEVNRLLDALARFCMKKDDENPCMSQWQKPSCETPKPNECAPKCYEAPDACGSMPKPVCDAAQDRDACPPPSCYEGMNLCDVKDVFAASDCNQDGITNRDDYDRAMNILGLDDQTTQNGIWKTVDKDNSGQLEDAEMSQLYKKMLGVDKAYNERDMMRLMLSENLAAMQAAAQATNK